MRTLQTYFIKMSLLPLIVACSSSGFSGGNNAKEDKPVASKNPPSSDDNEPPTSRDMQDEDTGTAECIPRVLPLRVMFALDISYSMKPSIELVKSNLVEFGQELRKIVPTGAQGSIQDLEIGLVTFIDDVRDEFKLTSNIDALSSEIRSLSSILDNSNRDSPEGGLAAAKRAVELMQGGVSSSQDAVTLLVITTDNYAHDGAGGAGARTYTSPALQQIIAGKYFKYLRIFDASPQTVIPDDPRSPSDAARPTNKPPAEQWENIRNAWRRAHNNTAMASSGSLGFPPSRETLLRHIPKELQKSLRVCK